MKNNTEQKNSRQEKKYLTEVNLSKRHSPIAFLPATNGHIHSNENYFLDGGILCLPIKKGLFMFKGIESQHKQAKSF